MSPTAPATRTVRIGIERLLEDDRSLVAGARVVGTITRQGRGPKLIVFKHKRRKNYRRKQGHRQEYTEVRVETIEG